MPVRRQTEPMAQFPVHLQPLEVAVIKEIEGPQLERHREHQILTVRFENQPLPQDHFQP